MSYEVLAHWLAEVGHHGFDQFTEAHTWALAGRHVASPYAALRELSALAYIEVDWRRRTWGAAPSCLTLLPDAGGHGLLVGARTARLTREVDERIQSHDAIAIPVAQTRAPDSIFIAAGSETALERAADALEIPYAHSVVERLAAVLPGLDAELVTRRTHPVVMHYGVDRYDIDDGWSPVDSDDAPGMYKYERSGPTAIHFVDENDARFDVDLAVGAWAEARRRGVSDLLWWKRDFVNGTLDVPQFLPLPSLHARAATLCSGLPARFHDGSYFYVNVPEWLAHRIASDLAQVLIVK